MTDGSPRHLLSIADLSAADITELMGLARSFAEVSSRPIPKVPALRGITVATVFFEASTRTRLSFETAAKRLSADTMAFSAQGSSLSKGESIRDTVETLDAMGVDVMVVRHSSAGVPAQVARWIRGAVVNAGDGQHEHPTQALLDCYTILEALSERRGEMPTDLAGLRVGIVGDVARSRVARSLVLALQLLGASAVLVGPATFLPHYAAAWGVETSSDLDAVLSELDVCYLLRIQHERGDAPLIPSTREYATRFGLSLARAHALKPDALILHPGPMNRGVEIAAEVAGDERARITRQVTNGVALRMAVLFHLAGGRLDGESADA
jgi:aspartate carbamoyltransferase catalytic subunit